mgnify:CR=1 FL=1
MPIISNKTLANKSQIIIWKIDESLLEISDLLKRNTEEINKVIAIRNEKVRKEKLICHVLIQSFFDENCYLTKNDWGAPELSNTNKRISLTHSYPYVGLYIADHPCGVDLEKVTDKIVRIKHKFLNHSEDIWASEDIQKITQVWSAKEVGFKIYQKGNVNFKDNMDVKPSNGSLDLFFTKPDCAFKSELNVDSIEGTVLIYGQLN